MSHILSVLGTHAGPIAQVLLAAIAFVAVVIGPFMQLHIANRRMRVDIRSSNRVRWIENLREELAEFISLCGKKGYINHQKKNSRKDEEKTAKLNDSWEETHFRSRELISLINLRLNPLEQDHQDLLAGLERLHHASNGTDDETIEKLMAERKAVVQISQRILKREWERVKLGQ